MNDPLAWLRQAATEAPAPARPAPSRRIEPSPAGHPMAWADQGACVDLDPDLFYPQGQGGATVDPKAVAACRTCPVAAECLDWALRHEHHGYWGGQSERGRRRLRRTLNIRLDEDTTEPTPTEDSAA